MWMPISSRSHDSFGTYWKCHMSLPVLTSSATAELVYRLSPGRDCGSYCGTGFPVPQMVSLLTGSYEPVCQRPPPPVFHALFLSFQVSLPGSPGLGTAYHRQSSLPVRASSAASQPRVPPSPAPFATSTLPSATSGAAESRSLLPNSFGWATFLSQTISPLSRLYAITRPSGVLA